MKISSEFLVLNLVFWTWAQFNGVEAHNRHHRHERIEQGPERPICVPRGTCLSNSHQGPDPRIMLPDNTNTCASGKELCTQSESALRCGFIYRNSLSVADGFAPYGSHPWLAYLVNQTGFMGSGVLLTRRHILTAAHKIYRNRRSLENLQVYLGVNDPNNLDIAYRRKVDAIRIHPEFDPRSLRNDVAIIKIKAHVPLGYQNNIATACLPSPNERFTNQRCMVAGWGVTSFGSADAPTAGLKQVTVPIVSHDTCRRSMQRVLGGNTDFYLDRNGEICAGGELRKDACTEDGGAPLICNSAGRRVVAGIVIWGKKCAQPGVYGVYADIPRYVEWIDDAIKQLPP